MRLRLRLDRLEQLLAASRVSQNHWAMRLGLSRGHWSDLINGRHPYPSARTRARMLEVFGLAERDLFEPDHAGGSDLDFRIALAARFELTSELGQGGMGTVYLANDLTLGRVVAVKMVAAEAVAGVGSSQLLQEIAMVSRLQHPNILPLFDAGERAGSPFCVMPWIRGGSLGAHLRSRARLPLAEATTLLDGIAAGLAHAHEHRVLHCDVKPENILCQDGHPWVMDFGIARKLHSEAGEWLSLRKELDLSAGTPAYVSPEQASGDPNLDARSDVYSLACVAYEMLAGRTPFGGETTQQIVSRRFEEPPPPLKCFAPDVPAAVVSVIERAMSLEPDRRPATATAFAQELDVAAQSASRWRSVVAVGASRVIRSARDATLGPAPSRSRRAPLREWLTTLRRDVVYSIRQRQRSPGLTVTAILTLGLGIGLVTAVFAVVNGAVLQPLPFDESRRLVALQSVDSTGGAFNLVSSANWADWQEENRTLESTAIHSPVGRVSVVFGAEAFRVNARGVSARFFSVLRSRFVGGRDFSDEDVAERRSVAVVADAFWRGTLGSAPLDDLSLQVNGSPYSIVGIVHDGQGYPEGTELWLLTRPRRFGGAERNNINYSAIGRLAPSVTISDARNDLSTIARRIHLDDPVALYSYGVEVTPLQDLLVSDSVELLRLLTGSAALVLLIACANLASANLAQGSVRTAEMAIRAALGASRMRLVRQVLVEHVMVAFAGGALGVLLASLMVRSAALLGAAQLPRAVDIRIDAVVLLFALLVAAVAGIGTGLLPALRATRAAPSDAMAGGTRGRVHGGRGLPGRLFVAAEIAMALMLVTGAALLVQSLRAVLARPLGFQTERIVTAEITLSGPRYDGDDGAVPRYWDRLRTSLAELPAVSAAGLVNWVPLVRGGTGFIELEGKDFPGASAGYRIVSEGYFEALGMRLLQGRFFHASDQSDGQRITVISRRMAERYWPGESPLGKRVRPVSMEPGQGGAPSPWVTVVGVVNDARPFGQERDETAEMYVLYRQLPDWRIATMSAVVRGGGSAESLMRTVRAHVATVDPGVPADLEFLQTFADRVTASRRFTMLSLLVFGGLALVLAAIGVYGVLSFAVAQRTREIAVRAALGADQRRLQRMVFGNGATLLAAGVVAGVLGAYYLSQLARSLLFEVEPRDPAVFAVATMTIIGVGLLAAVIPARRASRVEPMEALRGE